MIVEVVCWVCVKQISQHTCGQPPYCSLERFVSELGGWVIGRAAKAACGCVGAELVALCMLCLWMGEPTLHWKGAQMPRNSSKTSKLKRAGWLFVWSKSARMCWIPGFTSAEDLVLCAPPSSHTALSALWGITVIILIYPHSSAGVRGGRSSYPKNF